MVHGRWGWRDDDVILTSINSVCETNPWVFFQALWKDDFDPEMCELAIF